MSVTEYIRKIRSIRDCLLTLRYMKRYISVFILIISVASLFSAEKDEKIGESYAWTIIPPLGLHEAATIDTTLYNYFRPSVASAQSIAFASTGNLGGEGINMILFERQPISPFFFRDALSFWLPLQGNHKYYNTRIPMTLLSYNTSGTHENAQDRLQAVFSGNANQKLQFGAMVDYLYSQGSYANQAAKDFAWGLSSSYMGDRYEMQMFYNHYHFVNRENGGITDDMYIIDPAVLQGGTATINPKSIPTRLSSAFSRLAGQELYVNSRYKVGYWHITPPNDTIPGDTIEHRTYIPVSSFIWTFNYNDSKHQFDNSNATQGHEFWKNNYISLNGTIDNTSYWSLSNTFGVSLLEGFHKYAKAGLGAYITHEIRKYTQTPDSIPISGSDRPEGLTPYPFEQKLSGKNTENLLFVGGQLTKQTGRLLKYNVNARFGLLGPSAGDIKIWGDVSTLFKIFGDSVRITGYGDFSNEAAPYLMKEYVSNHFIWKNDFGKIRRLKLGGYLSLPMTGTYVNVGVENIQNLLYFNSESLPMQEGGNIQVFSASLHQDFRFKALNWRNRITYQTTSNQNILPAPQLALYSNLYLLFKVAKVLDVQFGVDCDYYTKYYAPNYQPATMTFSNQQEIKVGNYPFMNVYANMKLSRARFYIMMSHVNQGLMGNRYFALPHYPMNPRRFQMGVSVDFAN